MATKGDGPYTHGPAGASFANGNGQSAGNMPPGCGGGWELKALSQETSWTLTLGMLAA